MPLYGRSFANTAGPGSTYSGAGQGSWEAGIYDYKALPANGDSVRNDFDIGASWSYDEAQRMMVTYDTPAMMQMKAGLIKDIGLGGAMYWESSGDRKGEGSLISTVSSLYDGLGRRCC